ncbi:ABC transporter substrate-binding protein [Archaeoglobus veneficus]|nr:ABC transporter substrate-binding protein [Archaeoglobus veneficus]
MISNKTLKVFIEILVLAVVAAGCAEKQQVAGNSELVKYAENFAIEYHGDYKVLKVKDGNIWKMYILYHDKRPDLEGIAIKVPVKRLVVMSSTHLALLEAINATDCVVGYTYGGKYKVYFSDVAKKLKSGEIIDLGSSKAPDYEKLIELHPDLVVCVSGYNEEVKNKLEELGIPYIANSEWLEKDPLARAEWVKFFAALLDKEDEAEKYFSRIEENVKAIRNTVNSTEKVNLLWATIYRGKVYVPRGDSYVAKMAEYAGCNYLFNMPGTGSEVISLEDLLVRGEKADVMVYSSYRVKSLKDIEDIDSRLADLKVFREGRIYNITPDYWQLGLLHTDVVIKDLAAIAHPDLFKGYTPRFFVRLS